MKSVNSCRNYFLGLGSIVDLRVYCIDRNQRANYLMQPKHKTQPLLAKNNWSVTNIEMLAYLDLFNII